MRRGTRLPEPAVRLIYEFDPTYHRDQFQAILSELPWTVSIWRMMASERAFHLAPPEGVEFKEEG